MTKLGLRVMDIISRAAWGAKPPTNSLTPMRYPEGWVVHYVGVNGMNHNPTHDQSCATMRSIQDYAQHHGYSDFEYNFAVDPCGRVFEGRGWDYGNAANGTTSSNNHTWAVVYLGGEDMPLYPAARNALFQLTQAGAQRWGGVAYVKPHRAVAPKGTSCPGNETAAFCTELQAHLHDTTVAPPPPPPEPPKPKGHKLTYMFTCHDHPYAPARLAVFVGDGIFYRCLVSDDDFNQQRIRLAQSGLPAPARGDVPDLHWAIVSTMKEIKGNA